MKTNKNILMLIIMMLIGNVTMAQSSIREYLGTWQGVNEGGTVYLLQVNVDNTASLSIDGKVTGVVAVRIESSVVPAIIDFVVNDVVTLDQYLMCGIVSVGETDNGGLKMVLEYDEGMNRPSEFNSPIVLLRQ